MNLGELRDILNDLCDEHGEDAPVRLQSQPAWPLEYEIRGVVTSDDIRQHGDEDDDEDGGDEDDDSDTSVVVYIVEGTQLGYGSKAAWDI